MKKITGTPILLLILFITTSCTTTGFMGLAKESYVKQVEEENKQLKQEIGTIKEDMEKVLELADGIEELEALTRDIESKLDELPEDTLRKLADIIDDYLSKKKRVKAVEPEENDRALSDESALGMGE